MSESAADKRIRDLNRQLENEKRDHARTRNELQQQVFKVWRLVPAHYINLMGVFPPLRKLLAVLTELADLQDPSRSAPVEDTMRVDFIHEGDNASTSATEAGVHTHQVYRSSVKTLNRDLEHLARRILKILDDRTDQMARLVPGSDWEYDPPTPCESCGGHVVQPPVGRPRKYCQDCAPRKTPENSEAARRS